MTLPPRFLVTFWAGVRIARFARRLRSPGHDTKAQRTNFVRLTSQLASTRFWREQGVRPQMTYGEFRERIPPHGHAWFQPYLDRMAAGEPGLLLPGKCPLFVRSAGTTGTPKLLPVPEMMLAHYRAGLRDALFHYVRRAGHAGVFAGRYVHYGTSTAVTEVDATCRTSLDGMLALCVSPWVDANLRALPSSVAKMPEGSAKAAAAAKAVARRDVTLIGGSPARLLELADAVLTHSEPGRTTANHLQAIWPNLECCLHTGAPLGVLTEIIRQRVGPSARFHEVYTAAEGIFAAQDEGSPAALRLITDTGVFFEFLPLTSFQDSTVEHAGASCLPLDEVQAGIDYVLIVTTPAGLCRYATGDIVRFVSANPPRLQVVGRTALRLNAAGEHVGEREVTDTLQAVCGRNGWHVVAFHVAPYEQRLGPGQVAHVHEWWLELGTHSIKTPMANVLGPEIDAELARRSPDYAIRRQKNQLGAPQIRLVIPGVFAHWEADCGKIGNGTKLPCCRPDRLIADQLAALAPFHQAPLVSVRNPGSGQAFR